MKSILHTLLESRQPQRQMMYSDPQLRGHDILLSSGEASFLWAFSQASIMLPEVRESLRRSWGLCARHASGWLIVETAFRHRYLHGPAVLYDDLMAIADDAMARHGPLAGERTAWHLVTRGPCHVCAMGIGPSSAGFIEHERWDTARNATGWLDFLAETRPLWHAHVCGRCDGSGRPARCRCHLIEDLVAGENDVAQAAAEVHWIAEHVHHFDRSFRWECQDSDTAEDHAALVVAIGWCSGWSSMLTLDRADIAACRVGRPVPPP